MQIADEYSRWAESYDSSRNLTRDLDLEVTAEVLGSRRFGMAVEAGCGTGKNTSLLAGICSSLLGLDFSAGMLAIARQRVTAANVRFEKADLSQAWPCGDAVAELVSFNLVLEHFERLDSVFLEAARVLRPSGWLYVGELHPYRQYLGRQARFLDRGGELTCIEAFPHHISDYLRAAEGAGFELDRLDERWHADDSGKPPRLLSLLFRKTSSQTSGPAGA